MSANASSSGNQYESNTLGNATNHYNKFAQIDTELSRKLQDRRDSIANGKQEQKLSATTSSLEIDTNLRESLAQYSTSSGSSANNESPNLTSNMISPEINSFNNNDPPATNRIYEIISNEKTLNSSHSSSSSTSSQSSSSSSSSSASSIDMYQPTQRSNLTSFVISAKSKSKSESIPQSNDIILQNKSSLLNELKALIPVIDDTQSRAKSEHGITQIPPPPPPPLPFPRQQPLLIVPTSMQPTMTTFLPSKVAKAAGGSINASNSGNVKSAPPMVAPKNFSTNDLTKKKQILSMRDNLMDSIKGFNISNLKKVSNQME